MKVYNDGLIYKYNITYFNMKFRKNISDYTIEKNNNNIMYSNLSN